ncbi:MAG: VacB/RNase II family 3'-5' exoribonuclease, partial [Pseudomonadota bacterium]
MPPLPSKSEVLDWINAHPGKVSKRDIAKAFGIKGAARIDLKRMLKALEEDGHIERQRKTYRDPDKLPPVSVLTVLAPDASGDVFCKAMEWQGEGPEPRILFVARAADPALAEGDRILARLQEVAEEEYQYEARLIRRIGRNPRQILGIFRKGSEGGRIVSIAKGSDKEWRVAPGDTQAAQDGELVQAELAGPGGRMGLPKARIVERLGDPSAPKSTSLVAIHEYGIPDHFPDEVLAQAAAAEPVAPEGRLDLREMPLITIDPADARDHDDAVYAVADDDPKNPGGFKLWVAIADVAHYVRPGSTLDREARKRGNSTYFPDRVVPMLPEALSGDLCSLHEGVDRACLAACLTIDRDGALVKAKFHRAIMRSHASLTYEQAQTAIDGTHDKATAPLLETVLEPLYAAFAALLRARAKRQPLELDLPERQIVLSDTGQVQSVAFKERLDAHRLIEECMILANVAAAQTLQSKRQALLYRVHEEPEPDRLEALREVAQTAGLNLAKGQVLQTAHLNRLLSQAAGLEAAELINLSTLRAMSQAYYNAENFGHFGLALKSYAHFTSPIRRYADLVVHRALIAAHGWGDDGLSPEEAETLEKTAEHISQTERRSMAAERDTT